MMKLQSKIALNMSQKVKINKAEMQMEKGEEQALQ